MESELTTIVSKNIFSKMLINEEKLKVKISMGFFFEKKNV
jgi:hypothetical protein